MVGDDPRLSMLAGASVAVAIRRALSGYFAERIGVSKADSWIDMTVLEDCLREDLNESASRRIAILKPLKLIIDNYPEHQEEELLCPKSPALNGGKRTVPFSKILYIEQDDFMEEPTKGYFRLSPGAEVRLRYAFIIKCVDVERNTQGEIEAIHCIYDPDTQKAVQQARIAAK